MQARFRKKSGPVSTIFRRFRTENMVQTAAALAFTTLLSLVPLVTLVVSVSSVLSFSFFDELISRFNSAVLNGLLPAGSANIINNSIWKFTQKARSLTVPGVAMLALTAFLLMQTIEQAFNHLWQVKPRPFLQRIKLYAFVMVLWPFLMGGLAALMSYAITTSLGFVNESYGVRRFLFKSLSTLLLGLFFAFLYYAVPNVKVSKRGAILGGAFATGMFALMQKGFEIYLASMGTFKSIYGAFAAVPIFLIWLHLSWVVVLFGGLMTATLFRPARQ